MNRILVLALLISLIGCCNETELLKNGLTKPAVLINEYDILIEKDSNNVKIHDTLSITVKKYNDDNQIINLFQQTLIDDEYLEIDYIYNSLYKIEKEIVKLSSDSLPIIVNYFYRDTLLFQTKGIVQSDTENFEQIETYYYRKNNTIEKIVATQIYINLETRDTIRNVISTSYFDKNKLETKMETVDKNNPTNNRKIVYLYDCENIIGQREFDRNDSLISTFEYEYDLDKYDNWTENRIYEKGELQRIFIRELKYK